MKTCSPTWTRAESPSWTGWTPAGTRASWSSARSARGSDARTFAAKISPLMNCTVTSSAICTTWAAVRTLPSVETSTPEPTSLNFASTELPLCVTSSLPLARTTTTDPLTRWKAWDTPCAWTEEGVHARRAPDSSRRLTVRHPGTMPPRSADPRTLLPIDVCSIRCPLSRSDRRHARPESRSISRMSRPGEPLIAVQVPHHVGTVLKGVWDAALPKVIRVGADARPGLLAAQHHSRYASGDGRLIDEHVARSLAPLGSPRKA